MDEQLWNQWKDALEQFTVANFFGAFHYAFSCVIEWWVLPSANMVRTYFTVIGMCGVAGLVLLIIRSSWLHGAFWATELAHTVPLLFLVWALIVWGKRVHPFGGQRTVATVGCCVGYFLMLGTGIGCLFGVHMLPWGTGVSLHHWLVLYPYLFYAFTPLFYAPLFHALVLCFANDHPVSLHFLFVLIPYACVRYIFQRLPLIGALCIFAALTPWVIGYGYTAIVWLLGALLRSVLAPAIVAQWTDAALAAGGFTVACAFPCWLFSFIIAFCAYLFDKAEHRSTAVVAYHPLSHESKHDEKPSITL